MTLQKKSYKALLGLCGTVSPQHAQFVSDNLVDLQVSLLYSYLCICAAPALTLPGHPYMPGFVSNDTVAFDRLAHGCYVCRQDFPA